MGDDKVELIQFDLSHEMWREYEFGPDLDRVTYRIVRPVELLLREGGTTHRVVDSIGVCHCIPRPGLDGCVLRWQNHPGMPHCEF